MATAKQVMKRIKKRDEYLRKSGSIGAKAVPSKPHSKKKRKR
ncbi:hypothetical protein LCGC14_1556040 [marine sediment metagenome]|uniref:Uncharacterized protein n=1 Tax=marine sediment metagenome TaxID=412755 RepID=A0A0F9INX4_9ZZZZ